MSSHLLLLSLTFLSLPSSTSSTFTPPSNDNRLSITFPNLPTTSPPRTPTTNDNHPRLSFQGALSSRPYAETQLEHPHPPLRLALSSSASLSAYPSALDDGSDCVLTYSVSPVLSSDYVTVSCGATSGLNDYLDRVNVTCNSTACPSVGKVRFSHLIMLRCSYRFQYVQNGAVLAVIDVPMRESSAAPKQGHIAFTEEIDEMNVMYVSGSNSSVPSVRYGSSPGSYPFTTTGSTHTYKATDMCNAPANVTSQVLFRDPGFMHSVTLSGLAPSTTYYYQYGNDRDGWSDERWFHTRPLPGSEAAKTAKFLMYADMGLNQGNAASATSVRALAEVIDGYSDFLLHVGDISYARASAWQWDAFFTLIEPYASRVPYLVSVGNHEYDHVAGGDKDPSHAPGNGFHPSWGNMGSDSAGECAVPVVNRFTTPSNGEGLFWYSFDYGPVHVVQMSSEHDWLSGSKQYDWIIQDLAAVNRTETPFVILTTHRMMYTTQLGENNDYIVSEHFKAEYDDVLMKYRVNAVLVGHQHSYERSCPVYMKKCVPDGKAPVHIIAGTAGAGLEGGGFSNKLGNWSTAHIEDWGLLRIKATQEEMHIEFVLNDSGMVWDEVTLKPY